MTWLTPGWRVMIPLLLCLGWSGCSPSGTSSLEEEKNPNYLAGRSRRAASDYTGAVEAFEKALESNPRSAAARLELGLIYYQNITTNWARAIYHFEKYLELRPKANNADLIRQNVEYCRLALAREAPYTPNNDLVRREIERLTRDNTDLRQQVDQLKSQLALRAAIATNGTAAANPIRAPGARPPQAISEPAVEYAQVVDRFPAASSARETARPASASRTHVIQSGDTPYSIARNYGVKLASLVNANPGMDSRRLRPGQTLIIPLQ